MELLLASFTLNSQSNGDALILDAVDEFTTKHATVVQLKTAQLQRGIQDVSLPERSPLSEVAVRLAAVGVWYDYDVLRPYFLWLQLGPFDFVHARLASQDTWQGDVLSPSANDLRINGRLKEVL